MSDLTSDLGGLYAHLQTDKCRAFPENGHARRFLMYARFIIKAIVSFADVFLFGI